jgi:hypothetical protein
MALSIMRRSSGVVRRRRLTQRDTRTQFARRNRADRRGPGRSPSYRGVRRRDQLTPKLTRARRRRVAWGAGVATKGKVDTDSLAAAPVVAGFTWATASVGSRDGTRHP